jgi:hypothetical protein
MANRKLEILSRVCHEIPEDSREPIDQAMITWWANIRDDGGLRLTHHGYRMLKDVLGMQSWVLNLGDPDDTGAWRAKINKRTVLALDRKLEWPYYLDFDARRRRRRIVFFGSQEAMMAQLYGDITAWLNSLGSRHSDDHVPGS